MDRYAVMGNPIAHSKSPRIHTLFAAQTGQDLVYDALLVEPGAFDQAVGVFVHQGGRGLNVTVPFKQDAWRLCPRRSERAARAQAVNTIAVEADGGLFGDNTDGIGLLRDLSDNHGVALAHKAVLVLGAGGAVRGVLAPLLQQTPQRLVVANRTVAKAEQLAREFQDLGPVEACGFDALHGDRFDVVINGTAASLQGAVPPLPPDVLAPDSACYDMMYGPEPTAFMNWSRQQGASQVLDGLGMLVEQAAESFRLWRGVQPRTAPVIEALRAEMGA